MKLNVLVISLFSLLSFQAFSQNQKPAEEPACKNEGFVFKNHQLVLNSNNTVKSRIFLIQNISPGLVMLDHKKNPPSVSAGWASRIANGNWSAIAVNQPNFNLDCSLYQPPQIGAVGCEMVISVCAFSPKSPQGTFWAAENQSLLAIVKALKQRNMID